MAKIVHQDYKNILNAWRHLVWRHIDLSHISTKFLFTKNCIKNEKKSFFHICYKFNNKNKNIEKKNDCVIIITSFSPLAAQLQAVSAMDILLRMRPRKWTKMTKGIQKVPLRGWFVEQKLLLSYQLAPTLGVTKLTWVRYMNLVTFCCVSTSLAG